MRLPQTLRKIRRDQGGFAVPTATLMLFAATAIVTVGVMSSVRTQSGTTRDQNTKSALPQAEAGVNQALLHFNRIAASGNPCAPVTATAPDAGGWCGPVAGGFDGGDFAYYVRPTSGALEVVATGTYSGVSRRVHATAHSSSGHQAFAEANVLSQDGIQMDSNSQLISNVATNGDISLSSNSKICGQASVGVGKQLTTSGNAKHYDDTSCTVQGGAQQGELNLPPVNQGDAPTNNDNSRFFALDPASGSKGDACWNGIKASGQSGTCTARHLSVAHNSAVTMGGSKYSFCRLNLTSNAALYVQSGATTVIYFDTPEACNQADNTVQLQMDSNTRMTSTAGGPANVVLLFVGSASRRTVINLNSNTAISGACETNFIVYAPRSDVHLNSNSTFCGALAGKTIELDSNAKVQMHGDASNYILPNTPPHYELDRFVECTSSAAGQPSAGC